MPCGLFHVVILTEYVTSDPWSFNLVSVAPCEVYFLQPKSNCTASAKSFTGKMLLRLDLSCIY